MAARRADLAASSPRRRSTTRCRAISRRGRYEPRPSVPTLANAMDVGDPSNVERMRWLFDDDSSAMRAGDRRRCTPTPTCAARSATCGRATATLRPAHRDRAISALTQLADAGRRHGVFSPRRIPPSSARPWSPSSAADSAAAPLAEAMARARLVERIPPRSRRCEIAAVQSSPWRESGAGLRGTAPENIAQSSC